MLLAKVGQCIPIEIDCLNQVLRRTALSYNSAEEIDSDRAATTLTSFRIDIRVINTNEEADPRRERVSNIMRNGAEHIVLHPVIIMASRDCRKRM